MIQKPGNRQTIAVDIDDVLAANAKAFAEFSNKRWGTQLEPGDYTEHWAEMWQVDNEEVDRRKEVILREKVFLKHQIFSEARPVLQKLATRYNLVVLSSRGKRLQKETIAWIDKEFVGIFSGFHFLKVWDSKEDILEKLKGTKVELLQEMGADYLIDDQPKHCIAAAEAGVTALLFGDYEWNRAIKLKPGMVRVRNWAEVEVYFNAKG